MTADVAAFVAAFELAVVDEEVGVFDFLDLGLVDVGDAVPGERRVLAEADPGVVSVAHVGDVAFACGVVARVDDQRAELVLELVLLFEVERIHLEVVELLVDERLHVDLHEVLQSQVLAVCLVFVDHGDQQVVRQTVDLVDAVCQSALGAELAVEPGESGVPLVLFDQTVVEQVVQVVRNGHFFEAGKHVWSAEATERLEDAPRLLLFFGFTADAELFAQVFDVVALVRGEDLEVEAEEVFGAEAEFLAVAALVDDEELAGEAGVEQRVFCEEVFGEERAG